MLFISRCRHCSGILLMATKVNRHEKYSCSRCVPKYCGTRDDARESYAHELLYLYGNKKKQKK